MTLMPDPAFEQRVAAVRRFSRFYTRQIGLLQASLLESPFSLSEARVLYELAQRQNCSATELAAELGLDHGYLSRILRGFEQQGLIDRKRSSQDGRQIVLSLTTRGRKAFATLDHLSQRDMEAMLRPLAAGDQARIVAAMGTIERLVGNDNRGAPAVTLRSHRPGDMGWVVARHGALYAEEYGWDISFEALVAEIVGKFLKDFDPAREHCWIAEMDGEPVGSVFLVNGSAGVAKLRLLIVDPQARGQGVGRRLVEECIRFARAKGYRKITLWTQSILTGARHIYESHGFKRVAEQPHDGWGVPLVGETWELTL